MADDRSGSKPQSVDYSSNSHKSKQTPPSEEARIVNPIIKGTAKERKEPLRRKFLQAYTGDSAQSVGQYLLLEVVVPASKNLIADLVTQGINRILYGSSRPAGGGVGSIISSRTGYTKFFNGGAVQSQPQMQLSQHARANHAFGEIVFTIRSDAEQVLDELRALIEEYGNAKVVDLYRLTDVSSEFTDQKYGWTNLARASVQPIREGYLLDLPRPEVLP